jgi:hypothetical protein
MIVGPSTTETLQPHATWHGLPPSPEPSERCRRPPGIALELAELAELAVVPHGLTESNRRVVPTR